MSTEFSAGNPLAALSDHFAALAAQGAAVTVAVHGRDGRTRSGLIWAPDQVVTAEESLERDDELAVTLPDGSRVAAALTGRDPGTDIALLRVPTGPVAPLALAPPELLAPGHLVLVAGRGEHGAMTGSGCIAQIGGPWRSLRGGRLERRIGLALKLGVEAEGGPVLDCCGRLVGMAVPGPRRQLLAIPAETIARIVAVLAAHGRVARGYLGVATQPLAQGRVRGLIVVGVDPVGPAAAAGVLLGDILTALDGAALASVREMLARLDPETVGRDLGLDIVRAGAPLRLEVRVAERPSA